MERIKPINKLRLRDVLKRPDLYGGLADGLVQLPLPGKIKIGLSKFDIPADLNQFSENICYGQRLFIVREEENDIGAILRVMDAYYFPLVTGKKWDDNKALLFGRKVLNCTAKELYPVSMHLVTIVSELVEREKKLLSREPSKLEKAAGIEKLSVFSELTALDFLRQSMGKTEAEVMLTPYNECLVRFMLAREQNAYNERYMDLMKIQSDPKSKAKFNDNN